MDVTDPDQVFRAHARELSFACCALAAATEAAAEYIEHKKRSFNPYTHASMSRLHLRDTVVNKGDAAGVTHSDLANCGVLVQWDKHLLHVRKSDHGEPHAPGGSTGICSLYNQSNPRQMTFAWSNKPSYSANQDSILYILHWLARRDGRLADLFLAYPIAATRSTVKWLWNERVPDYIRFGLEQPSSMTPPTGEDDLPFEVLPDEDEGEPYAEAE